MVDRKFIDVPLNAENLDIFHQRNAVFNAIKSNLTYLKGELLDVGCGKMPYRNYIQQHTDINSYTGIDIDGGILYDSSVRPDIFWDGIKMPVPDCSYDTVIATEVLEHCPDPNLVISEISRVLKTRGYFFFTVPFLWNLHEVPHDEFRYTPFSIERFLKQNDFNIVSVNATGGWHASLAQMAGLWVRRAPLGDGYRKLLAIALKPVIRYLLKKDKKITPTFSEGSMITGIWGIAQKK